MDYTIFVSRGRGLKAWYFGCFCAWDWGTGGLWFFEKFFFGKWFIFTYLQNVSFVV